MKTLKLILVSLLIASSGIAQSITVPKQYTLITEGDFDRYEHNVVECANFLINTPINQQTVLRTEASSFLTDYVKGCQSLKVEQNLVVTPFIKNQDLLKVYIASWIRSYSEQNHVNNKEEFTIRAANETLNYYKANKSTIGKVKSIKRFMKMQADGKLDDFIKTNL